MKNTDQVRSYLAEWPDLDKAWQRQRLGQSLLLVGPLEAGQSLGHAIVRQVLCEKDAGPGCNCRACQTPLVNHPDYLCVGPEEGKKLISRKSVQLAVQGSGVRPLWGFMRAVHIPASETLSSEAESYLLKHIEEPPSYVVMILQTPDLDRLLATIRSRCTIIRVPAANTTGEVLPLDQLLAQDKIRGEDIVRTGYWVREQYRMDHRAEWLSLWEMLWRFYTHLEANGNAEVAREVLRRAWVRR